MWESVQWDDISGMTGDADMRVLALMDGPLHGAPVYSGYSAPIPQSPTFTHNPLDQADNLCQFDAWYMAQCLHIVHISKPIIDCLKNKKTGVSHIHLTWQITEQ